MMRRTAGAVERMDAADATEAELRRALADLRHINRWLGGRRSISRAAERLAPRDRPLRILDVASGGADVAVAVAERLRRPGRNVTLVAIDNHPRTVRLAGDGTAPGKMPVLCRSDARALPIADRAADIVLFTTALHHFEPEEAVTVLRELGRVAGVGVVVGDLRRSRAGWVGARLLAATAWRGSRLTRHDGPLSVRRSYTPAEVRSLAERAGLTGARVRRSPLFRLTLTWRRR